MGEEGGDVADLERQLSVLNERLKDANSHGEVRETKLRTETGDLAKQIEVLRAQVKALDGYVKKLSLLHSQLTAAPKYKLSKNDVAEIVRLVSTL